MQKRIILVGFTLIELLVVMAILGTLSSLVLIAINPLEQLAKARDTDRKTTLSSLSQAIRRYSITKESYPPSDSTWLGTLRTHEDVLVLSSMPYIVSGTQACTTNVQPTNGYCYVSQDNEAALWVSLESSAEGKKCTVGRPYLMWSSKQGAICLVCKTSEPDISDTCMNL